MVGEGIKVKEDMPMLLSLVGESNTMLVKVTRGLLK